MLLTMRAGDVLLFHGSTLHGSQPNRSSTRWRRAFVAHYIAADVRAVHEHFHPAFRATGEEIPAPGYAAAGG
jgi:ectoine hydroxylase-related dioxygenase (phytanoyl-CoA dioxygenase family)